MPYFSIGFESIFQYECVRCDANLASIYRLNFEKEREKKRQEMHKMQNSNHNTEVWRQMLHFFDVIGAMLLRKEEKNNKKSIERRKETFVKKRRNICGCVCVCGFGAWVFLYIILPKCKMPFIVSLFKDCFELSNRFCCCWCCCCCYRLYFIFFRTESAENGVLFWVCS